jgi:putative redox protein
MVLDRMNLSYEEVITKVEFNSDGDEESCFFYDVEIVGDIDEEVKEMIIQKAQRCPVRKALSKPIVFQPMER